MRVGGQGRERRDLSSKLSKTLVLLGLAIAAQVAIVAWGPTGKAQTLPPPKPAFPLTVITEGPANVNKGQSFGTSSLYETDCFTCTIEIAGQLPAGAQYFGVSPNQGQAVISPDRDSYTLTVGGGLYIPLDVQSFLGADEVGLLFERTQISLGDLPIVISSSVLSRDEPSDVTLRVRRTAVSYSQHVTDVLRLSPNSSTISATQVAGLLEGAEYLSVVSDRGLCQSVLAGFVCDFENLAGLRAPGTITLTINAATPGPVRQGFQVKTLNDVLHYTATSRVFSADVVQPTDVELDVNPFSSKDVVKLNRGFTFFALLSSESLEVAEEVDRRSLRFGRTGTEDSVRFCFRLDLRRDGLGDFFCLARTEAAGFQPGDTEAVVTGETVDGTPIRGTDVISTFPPN